MESPKSMNGITRRLDKQAYGGIARDFIFESVDQLTVSEFFNKAKPLIEDAIDLLRNEINPVKICSTIKNENGDSDTIYANEIKDYNLDTIISSLIKNDFGKTKLKFYLNVDRYDPTLVFMDTSDFGREHDGYGYHQCNKGSYGDDSPLFILNRRKWHEDDYDPNENVYFY